MPTTLGLDLDSTVWPFPVWMARSLSRRLGYQITPADVESWEYFDSLPARAVAESFAEALDPARVPERPFYLGCIEALRRLRDRGIRMAFVTSNPDPPPMRQPLARWLCEALGEPVAVEEPDAPVSLQLLPAHEPKLPALREAGAAGIVDDRPQTLVEVADAGLWAATLVHRYNEALVANRPDIHGFDHWHEFECLLGRVPAFAGEILPERKVRR